MPELRTRTARTGVAIATVALLAPIALSLWASAGILRRGRTRDYVLVGGRNYRREPLSSEWVLRQFPARLRD